VAAALPGAQPPATPLRGNNTHCCGLAAVLSALSPKRRRVSPGMIPTRPTLSAAAVIPCCEAQSARVHGGRRAWRAGELAPSATAAQSSGEARRKCPQVSCVAAEPGYRPGPGDGPPTRPPLDHTALPQQGRSSYQSLGALLPTGDAVPGAAPKLWSPGVDKGPSNPVAYSWPSCLPIAGASETRPVGSFLLPGCATHGLIRANYFPQPLSTRSTGAAVASSPFAPM